MGFQILYVAGFFETPMREKERERQNVTTFQDISGLMRCTDPFETFINESCCDGHDYER